MLKKKEAQKQIRCGDFKDSLNIILKNSVFVKGYFTKKIYIYYQNSSCQIVIYIL